MNHKPQWTNVVPGELTQRTEEQSFPRATTQSLQRALPAVINTGSIENTELQLQSHTLKREEVGDGRVLRTCHSSTWKAEAGP